MQSNLIFLTIRGEMKIFCKTLREWDSLLMRLSSKQDMK